jgi:hypothetical protein
MRAISGAIITAAALLALGMIAQAMATRYALVNHWKPAASEGTNAPNLKTEPDFEANHIKIHHMDNGLVLCLVLATLSLLVGLGITFVGLMYHHHLRYHEHLRMYGQPSAASGPHVTS